MPPINIVLHFLLAFLLQQTTNAFTVTGKTSSRRYDGGFVTTLKSTAFENDTNNDIAATRNDASTNSDDNLQSILRDVVKPPPELQNLNVGETFDIPGTPVEIVRVASKPDMYVVRNLIPMEDRQDLISHEHDFESAETKSGFTSHRSNSRVSWVYSEDETKPIARFLERFCVHEFLHPTLLAQYRRYAPEPLQIANYELGGKFDIHHDGGGRVVTVLSYLNGVAGTWFPFAKVHHDVNEGDEGPPQMTLNNKMTEGMEPGRDGIWVVGNEGTGGSGIDDTISHTYHESKNPHIVRVEPGDAIVFYNYEYDEEFQGPLMCWRSLHAGMPAKQEKWIVTNWIDCEYLIKKR